MGYAFTDALAQQQAPEQGGGGYGEQQQQGNDNSDEGVRGAPIEGEGVKVRDVTTKDIYLPKSPLCGLEGILS